VAAAAHSIGSRRVSRPRTAAQRRRRSKAYSIFELGWIAPTLSSGSLVKNAHPGMTMCLGYASMQPEMSLVRASAQCREVERTVANLLDGWRDLAGDQLARNHMIFSGVDRVDRDQSIGPEMKNRE